MLAYQWHTEQGKPIVFLHGLLGSQEDWKSNILLLQKYPQFRPLTLDLPYHGLSQSIGCENVEQVRSLLDKTLRSLIGEQPFILVGYSLGGRIALDYALYANNPQLEMVFLEGANIGLISEEEKAQRYHNDFHWAERFKHEPIHIVLADWYQQAVFSTLSDVQRKELIQLRCHNDGKAIAKMLMATSLSKQAFLLPSLTDPILFLIGEKDKKFRQMAESYQLNYQIIMNAGHNAHRENPQAFVDLIGQFGLNKRNH